MKSLFTTLVKGSLAAGFAAAMAAASTATAALPTASAISSPPVRDVSTIKKAIPSDIAAIVASLGASEIVEAGNDGLPTFLRGDLGRLSALSILNSSAIGQSLGSAIGPALAAFRLTPEDLRLLKVNTDENGNRHARYLQTFRGLDVVGGDLVVHMNGAGSVYAINGTARGGFSSLLGSKDIGEAAALSSAAVQPEYAGLANSPARAVYFIDAEGAAFKAYETTFSGKRGQDPVRDKVYVDADSGRIVGVHPQIYFAESRKIYSANNGTKLPGTLKRSEGQAATSDTDVTGAYDGTGATWEAYKAFWNRDSYNNAGATLISSVHYDVNYCNAYWDSTQMVFGDGDSSQGCLPLARAIDVTGHELTHAVTENESALVYSGESGGLNEAISDIFGAFVEAYVDGGKTGTLTVSADTWKVGEDILPPALRYMDDPAKDGASLDYYTSTAGNKDVHYSSGIANLAFYLLSQGGKHPRGKSTVAVTGVGMTKAIRIFYEAQINVLTSNAKFLSAGNATVLAAQNLGYSVADQTSVANAWQAVGVAVPTPGGTTTPPTNDGVTILVNGTAVTASGAKGSAAYWKIQTPAGKKLTITTSGGSGDADLYTRFGSKPTTSTYDCRPYKTGNAETCTVTSTQAGYYYVLLNGYAAYSGVSLKASYP